MRSMTSRSSVAVIFGIGAALGAGVMWLYAHRKELLHRPAEEAEPEPEPEEEPNDIPEKMEQAGKDFMAYAKERAIMRKNGYLGDAKHDVYVIEPLEYGEKEGYAKASYTYYADMVLTDELDEMVDDVEGTIGTESLGHFGEYEDDSVYVRNDRLKCDFEILKDERRYYDVLKTKPHRPEVQ